MKVLFVIVLALGIPLSVLTNIVGLNLGGNNRLGLNRSFKHMHRCGLVTLGGIAAIWSTIYGNH